MQIDKSIKAKLLKFLLGLALMVTIFGLNSIDANACSNSTCGCGARGISCSTPCWFNSMSDKCSGHDFNTQWTTYEENGSVPRTCTQDGYSLRTPITHYKCKYVDRGICNRSDEQIRGSQERYNYQSHPGHSWSNWYWYGDYSNHRKECTQWCHNDSVDGSRYQYESHSLTSRHQHNDWKWHRDCTTYACNHDDIQTGWNYGTVIFHFENNRTSSEGDEASESGRIQSPGRETNAGKTLVGWNKRSTDVKVYNVQKVPGASLATWNWDAGSYKSVREVVPGAQNDEDAYDNAAAVYEWNHVRIHYRAGYDTDGTGTGLTKDNLADYVDYTQDLDSRKIDQFTRTGYDIITKGWFTTKTNEGTYTHHVDAIGDAVCTDTPAYAFNKNYKASEWSIKVLTQHTTDVYIYPHWRAHVLHVNYNTNGGVDSTGKSGVIEGATWYYDDGKSGAPQKTYYVTNTVPTKAGYVFMGWGNKATWSQERYARQIANEATGIKVAYDNTQAKSVAKTAQDWAAYCGKDLAAGDQTVTFYAQWERVITYKFYYYNDEANKAYYYEGGYQDCNTASVAFHNDDDEYLYMDIYMKRCCDAAFSVQKDADSGFFCAKN